MLDGLNLGQAGAAMLAAFLGSAVECVEALTVILAIGFQRGWRGALMGAAAALALLLLILGTLGAALSTIPLGLIQLVVGACLVLFGLRWLRKAILRAAGIIKLHDEAALFAEQTAALGRGPRSRGLDGVAITGAFNIVMLEGIEVVFIVIAIGSGAPGLLPPAALGAVAALILVILLGLALHRPIATLPENAMKFVVGTLLSAFGTFWVGEGIGVAWPGGDLAAIGLVLLYGAVALLCVRLCRDIRLAR